MWDVNIARHLRPVSGPCTYTTDISKCRLLRSEPKWMCQRIDKTDQVRNTINTLVCRIRALQESSGILDVTANSILSDKCWITKLSFHIILALWSILSWSLNQILAWRTNLQPPKVRAGQDPIILDHNTIYRGGILLSLDLSSLYLSAQIIWDLVSALRASCSWTSTPSTDFRIHS